MSIRPSEITPESLYLSRREFLVGVGALAAGAFLFSGCEEETVPPPSPGPTGSSRVQPTATAPPLYKDKLTPYDSVTSFNNFYEFSTSKRGIAGLSRDFVTSPFPSPGTIASTLGRSASTKSSCTSSTTMIRCAEMQTCPELT